ncbi:TPA: hypothetical protein N0F65_012630 [Lagenidium giganteum]|uniref:Amino acid transporter n=1 Tax=Lagenidium giganteum TaxID=4803 RepID=A0AAV2YGN0_9STRA|nr:TPA: hypothetical protein N0F65_012630 [Lagenidium giganteum]
MAHRRPGAIVLLDEEQQRALQQHDHGLRAAPRQPNHGSMGGYSNGSSMTPKSEPPRDARAAEPRTNFTTRSKDPRGGDVRTNFTTLTGGSTSTAGGTARTLSPRTDFTGTNTAPMPSQALPPCRSSDGASSSDETDRRDGSLPTNQYAGTSSGLSISITLILLGIVAGVGLGVGLGVMKVSPLTARWVGLPGDLFLRALKCLVIPYVFCSVAVAIGDIVFVGKVSVVGIQTAKIFVLMWISTTIMGTGLALLFRSLFRASTGFNSVRTNSVGFTCPNNNMLEQLPNGSLACSSNSTKISTSTAFVIKDVHNVFQKNSNTVLADLSLSDQLQSMIQSIISSNIAQSMSKGDLLSIITFAMVFGVIAGRSYFTKSRKVNYLYLVLLQLRNTFFLAMEWVIWLTPAAVISIIAGSFATNQDSLSKLGDVYMYVVGAICAALVQILVLLPFIIFILTRCNPYNHMRQMIRSYMFAFGAASSLATAPVTLGCLRTARTCSQSLANFVISIGVTSNMSGAGWYYPMGVIFLAESSGNGEELTAMRIGAIFGLSLLACAGTAPIPSSGLVMMTTIYKTVFGVSEMPATFPLVVAVDFFVDRISTVCNVNDDIMALKVIAENTDETITNELLGERY